MKTLSVSYIRKNLAAVMQCVNRDRVPIIITSERGRPVVMMSLEDYNEQETSKMTDMQLKDEADFLTRSPLNLKRLTEAAQRASLLRKEELEVA
jgi:antitoxin YefM